MGLMILDGNDSERGRSTSFRECTEEEQLDQLLIAVTDPSSEVRIVDLQDMMDGNKNILVINTEDGRRFEIGKDTLHQLKEKYPDNFPDNQILDRDGQPVSQSNHPSKPAINTDRVNTNMDPLNSRSSSCTRPTEESDPKPAEPAPSDSGPVEHLKMM